MKYIMMNAKFDNGAYGVMQTWNSNTLPENYVWVDEKFLNVFYPPDKKCAGFVDLELSEDGTTVENMTWNDDRYNAYLDTLPSFFETAIPDKIQEMSKASNQAIEAGIDVTLKDAVTTEGQEQDAVVEHFDLTTDDQINLSSLFTGLWAGMTQYPYHSKNGDCKLYTNQEIARIYKVETMHVTHHQTYFNQLKKYINSFNGADDSKQDEFNEIYYGQELTGEYLDKYNEMMNEAQAQVDGLLARLAQSLNIEV